MSLQIRYCNKVALLTKKCGNKTQFSDFAKLVGITLIRQFDKSKCQLGTIKFAC